MKTGTTAVLAAAIVAGAVVGGVFFSPDEVVAQDFTPPKRLESTATWTEYHVGKDATGALTLWALCSVTDAEGVVAKGQTLTYKPKSPNPGPSEALRACKIWARVGNGTTP